MNDKIAIIGGDGMLGTEIVGLLNAHNFFCTSYDLPEFDILDKQNLEKIVDEYDIIINSAAYTNVDEAESHIDTAEAVNATALGILGKFVAEYEKYVIHISTDFVFGENAEKPLKETDHPSPLNTYGKTKLKGEQKLFATGCKTAIIRVQWTYGENGVNFIEKIIHRAKQTKSVTVVDDQWGAPTSTKDVASAILKIMQKRSEGLFHYAAKGYTSRYDCARFVLDKMNIDTKISRAKTADFDSPAQRPLNSRFDCSKIVAEIGPCQIPWQKSLQNYLKTMETTKNGKNI
ncbi:MAG: dTDP-4-dehydrorhamnose reductase [Verrucomicrobiota bacterium]|nr:dTDP-4-dehydrorhamnose reductase [Verrucomicrobiota bacterium]